MNKKLSLAIKKVSKELSALDNKEFKRQLKKHGQGWIAKVLKETGALNCIKKERKYYIIKVNCDTCGSYREARTSLPRGAFISMRCKHCYKMIGISNHNFIGEVRARGDIEALEKYREMGTKKGIKNEHD